LFDATLSPAPRGGGQGEGAASRFVGSWAARHGLNFWLLTPALSSFGEEREKKRPVAFSVHVNGRCVFGKIGEVGRPFSAYFTVRFERVSLNKPNNKVPIRPQPTTSF
jgi:hypothetical protein